MKAILIIGLGRFGHHLCQTFAQLNNEIMIIDREEEAVADLLPIVTNARIGDCMKEEVLLSLGVRNFDICFVCIGTNFQSSLEITSMLKEAGAKYIVSKATKDIQAKFLLRNGADEVVYPDRDIAEKLAIRHSAKNVFDYVELNEEYSIYEISPLKEWIGRTIKEVNFRARYQVSIIGTKVQGNTKLLPAADHVFKQEEHLLVIGQKTDVEKILKYL